MVVTSGLVAYGSLGMNAPSTLRGGSASCVEPIAEVDSLGLVKRLVVTLPTQRHWAALFYRSTHGAVQNSARFLATPPCEDCYVTSLKTIRFWKLASQATSGFAEGAVALICSGALIGGQGDGSLAFWT